MYGARDAAHIFGSFMTRCMVKLGSIHGESNTCLFWNEAAMVSCVIHGDDGTPCGPKTAVLAFIKGLGELVLLKTRTILGPPGEEGCTRQFSSLNRLVI